MAKNALDRNFGSKKARGRENKRIARDKWIDKKIRATYHGSILRHGFHSLPIEPMSPYLGATVPFGQSTGTAFPVAKQYNNKPMPQFKDLSKWFKFNLATMAMQEYGFVTFNINLHPELEKQWVKDKKDPATELRARINKQVRKVGSCPDAGWEYAFIVEGWGKQSHLSKDWSNPKKVRLHIHGFAAVYEKGDEEPFRKAAARACGDGWKVIQNNHAQRALRCSSQQINQPIQIISSSMNAGKMIGWDIKERRCREQQPSCVKTTGIPLPEETRSSGWMAIRTDLHHLSECLQIENENRCF